MSARIAAIVVVLLLTGPFAPSARASAQSKDAPGAPDADRPTEQDLFGAPPARGAAPAVEAPERALSEQLQRTDNPLAIGGQLYLRSVLTAREGQPPAAWSLTAPSLVDAFLDARPSDRIRGFVLGRMFYDPTLDPNAPGFLGLPPPSNPRVLLDQLWIRFDAEKAAFFTVGKQHVKWGTGRFWNPTDFLHAVRRNPLSVFDPRTGTTMVRVHVPWERRGWNLYAMAILEPLTTTADATALSSADTGVLPGTGTATAPASQAGTVGGVGGAMRAEVVLGPSELAAGAVVQRGHKPRFALDASVGFWELDAYAEAAVKTGSEIPLFRQRAGATADTPLLVRYEAYEPGGLTPAITGGLRWAHKYSDEDSFEAGVEYFYNHVGYDDPRIYPWLLFQNAFTPFYLGRHYGGAYLALPNPGSWNHTTFILSTIGNLSDRSFVTRLDHSVLLFAYLRLETFVQAHYGRREGEFRLAISVPGQSIGPGVPDISFGPSVFTAGVAVRVSL